MSLAEKLEQIKRPNLQNQQQTALIVHAVEETLRDQKAEFTPTAYFAALLSLLGQSVSSKGAVNKDLATSVVYLLDLVAPYVPAALLRSKFTQILTSLVPVLTSPDIEAPLLRSSIGCLGTLLVAQDSAAWGFPPTQMSPRRALAGLLTLAMDHRPKVRKRAQDAIMTVLRNPPPSPSLDHPAADLCAETALQTLESRAHATIRGIREKQSQERHHESGLIHILHLVKIIAAASGGWPSKNIESLCEVLMAISRSSNEYLTIGALEVFETIFAGMADEKSSAKLPRLVQAISELKPAQNDSQLLPPWIAVMSRAYDVSFQVSPEDTFVKLPGAFELISSFLSSPSHNIRISASECLISFMVNCIPDQVVLEPSVYDEKTLEELAKAASGLLAIKYQSAWMEVFKVFVAMSEALKWRSYPVLSGIIATIGELRGSPEFQGKKEADEVLGAAITAMGPEAFLCITPLDMAKQKPGQQARPWLLPLLRDHVSNTNLSHFKSEFVPLSEKMYQRVLDFGAKEKTMEIKIFETLVHQIWSLLPGYCDLPLDLPQSFDQPFAEMISNLLYQQTDLRVDLCKALQFLVETNRGILDLEIEAEDMIVQRRVSKADAQRNINHLSGFAGNILAVLFNVYSETLPQYRGYILQCINSYLGIIPEQELLETFTRVATMLESALPAEGSQTQADKQKRSNVDKILPQSHTLMDLVITMSTHLPRSSFGILFNMAALTLTTKSNDPQLQKKAYKLIPRLAESPAGQDALRERNSELQQLFLSTADKTPTPVRHDRLQALSHLVSFLPSADLHFIPSILSEVVMACKETNEKTRSTAFDLLIQLAHTIADAPAGSTIRTSLVPHMPPDCAPTPANLSEFFTMVSAGLAGTTPHMVSASITALARLTYEFHARLSRDDLVDLVQTVDLFLTSNNREIVRSVLGFVKVAVISLPTELILPRLETLIPSLMVWSHEHSGRLRMKVKGIIERLVRRFGAAVVEKWTPEGDKKLVVHIRRERDRKKKSKHKTGDGGEEEEEEQQQPVQTSARKSNKFESEFDKAVYSSSDDDDDDDDDSDGAVPSKKKKRGQKDAHGNGPQRKQYYIHERESSPLDLLSSKALASISLTKPSSSTSAAAAAAASGGKKFAKKAKVDPDSGKLVFGGDRKLPTQDGDDGMDVDHMDVDISGGTGGGGDGGIGAGVNSYMQAVSGPDAVRKGMKGKLKVKSGMGKAERKKEADADAVDDDDHHDDPDHEEKEKEKEKERSVINEEVRLGKKKKINMKMMNMNGNTNGNAKNARGKAKSKSKSKSASSVSASASAPSSGFGSRRRGLGVGKFRGSGIRR